MKCQFGRPLLTTRELHPEFHLPLGLDSGYGVELLKYPHDGVAQDHQGIVLPEADSWTCTKRDVVRTARFPGCPTLRLKFVDIRYDDLLVVFDQGLLVKVLP